MYRSITSLALLLLLASCGETGTSSGNTVAGPSESERLNTWFDGQYEEQLQFSPIEMTFLGRKDRYDEIDSYTVAAEERELEWMRQSVREMEETFDYRQLDGEARTSWDIWKYQYEQAARRAEFRYNGFTFDQMNGAQSFLPTFLISFHEVDDPSDLEAYVSRIGEAGRAIGELLQRAVESANRGVVMPEFAIDGVIRQAQDVISGAPFTDAGQDSAIWADLKMEADALLDAGELDAERAGELLAQGETMLLARFEPVYRELIEWAESERSKVPEVSTGLVSQPDGEAYYQFRLANQTTTGLSADEIHEMGLADVQRLRGEMETVMRQTGFEGTLDEFFVMLREARGDERLYYPDTDAGRQAYIDDATQAIENIKEQLPDYFATLPQADLVVRRVEPFREQDGAAQHYYPGTPDGSRPGVYYAHLSDMTAMPKTELEVIAYHEGLPGHHMQISIAQELEELPRFRTQAGFTAYSEGWALYAERLASEMPGTYTDPFSEFGRLTSEMWRAIRLVVDTGLHDRGWTEQQAVDYFAKNASIPLAAIRSEVQRYIVMPGQATSYKVGMNRILNLREQAREALGEDFDIRGFHDAVLLGGAMPLAMLEQRVERWIAREQTE